MKQKLFQAIVSFLGLALIIAIAMNTWMTVTMYRHYKEEADQKNEQANTSENDVTIGYEYQILDTSVISDAYRSGDTSNLDAQQLETLQMAEKIIDEVIKDQMSDYEKELAIYEWMVEHISNDSGSVLAVPTRGQSVDRPYGVLKNRQAVCVGYATTFRLFMQMLDIDAKVVHDTENVHSWNMVKLEDEWYITDIYSDANGAKYYSFNVSEHVFAQRQQWDTDYFPTANGLKYNYAVMNREPLKNIKKLPKIVQEVLESNTTASLFYTLEGNLDSYNVQKAAYMLERLTEYAYTMYDTDGNLYIYTSIIPVDDEETVLGVYVNHLNQGSASSLNEEDRMEIDMILEELFGYGSEF